jgi:hypothetical protein
MIIADEREQWKYQYEVSINTDVVWVDQQQEFQ